jgi:hypothetical protein
MWRSVANIGKDIPFVSIYDSPLLTGKEDKSCDQGSAQDCCSGGYQGSAQDCCSGGYQGSAQDCCSGSYQDSAKDCCIGGYQGSMQGLDVVLDKT